MFRKKKKNIGARAIISNLVYLLLPIFLLGMNIPAPIAPDLMIFFLCLCVFWLVRQISLKTEFHRKIYTLKYD